VPYKEYTHTLLQYINVINFHLVESLLHFSPNSVVNRVQIWTVMSCRPGEMKAGVSLSRRMIVSGVRCVLLEDKELARDITHDKRQ